MDTYLKGLARLLEKEKISNSRLEKAKMESDFEIIYLMNQIEEERRRILGTPEIFKDTKFTVTELSVAKKEITFSTLKNSIIPVTRVRLRLNLPLEDYPVYDTSVNYPFPYTLTIDGNNITITTHSFNVTRFYEYYGIQVQLKTLLYL